MNISNNTISSFPNIRMRRNRSDSWIRRLVAENKVSVDDLVLPVFVQDGKNLREEIASMPGVYRLSIDELMKMMIEVDKLGIAAVALFPVVRQELKTEDALEACNIDNLVCRAVIEIKKSFPDIGVICDVALDPYTSHGQDGLVRNGYVVNDETVDVLCRQAVCLAEAGCDMVAPSDMMDGRVRAVRGALDVKNYQDVKILAYAAKYASSFYGPFRDAIGSAANLKSADKRTYQMDPANGCEALREVALDVAEGADIVMIKPGMPYLDVIKNVKNTYNIPVCAYQVSGEYAMLCAAAQNGWLDKNQVFMESMMAFKRAGASFVFTYAAMDIAQMLCDDAFVCGA